MVIPEPVFICLGMLTGARDIYTLEEDDICHGIMSIFPQNQKLEMMNEVCRTRRVGSSPRGEHRNGTHSCTASSCSFSL